MKPRFNFGDHVRVTRNVRNDGTFPGREVGELLLKRGSDGFVRDVGSFLQDQIIYSVDFIDYGYRVGCRQEELVSADEDWVYNRYEFRDRVTLTKSLSIKGEIIAERGSQGEIQKVIRDHPGGVHYHLRISGRTLLVPETSLSGESDMEERAKQSKARGVDVNASTRGATLPWQRV